MPILFFLPWIPVLGVQFAKSKESWLYPVDWQLVKSVLGNLFTGYQGTPGHLWKQTARLSAVILIFFGLSFKNKNSKPGVLLMPVILPLFIILSYSMLKRPLYVNRYLIYISVFEVIAVFSGIVGIKNRKVRKISAFAWMAFIIYFNIYITPFRKKTDFKSTFSEINHKAQNNDFVYTRTPIAFLESAYYFENRRNVFVYNPDNIHIPEYIGVNVVFGDVSRRELPPSPSKTFMVNNDAGFEIILQQ